MADVTISDLSNLAVASGLLLPVSNGSTTGKLTIGDINSLAPVQSVAGRTGSVVISKSDIGLSNVENKSSATIRSEITSANIIATGSPVIARAWVNFNGWGLTSGVASAATIRSQYNVASITWNSSTNYYDINFSTPMTDVNYAVYAQIGAYTGSATTTTPIYDRDIHIVYRNNTVNKCTAVIRNSTGSYFQDQFISIIVFNN